MNFIKAHFVSWIIEAVILGVIGWFTYSATVSEVRQTNEEIRSAVREMRGIVLSWNEAAINYAKNAQPHIAATAEEVDATGTAVLRALKEKIEARKQGE